MTTALKDLVLARPELADLDPGARRLALRSLAVSPGAGIEDAARLADDIDGYGVLTALMDDDEVTDILVNGPDQIWCERNGVLERLQVAFSAPSDLEALIDRLLSMAGERADTTKPIADARLADGSRLHVVLPPIARSGPFVSIRRFPRRRWGLFDLVEKEMLLESEAELLADHVARRRTIVVSGGTGTGKTTLLNALLSQVPEHERVVTIEETPELAPVCAHVVSLTSRDAGTHLSAVGLPALLRAALRMRPDRIVVGEVRGAEALTALTAMTTGHAGSMLTVHASSSAAARRRLVLLARDRDGGVSEQTLTDIAGSAIDVVVHLERDGERRRVADIDEG